MIRLTQRANKVEMLVRGLLNPHVQGVKVRFDSEAFTTAGSQKLPDLEFNIRARSRSSTFNLRI